jgi:FkbM family methyltransferase
MSFSNKIRGLKEVWAFDNRAWLTFTKLFFPKENLQVYRFGGMDILIDRAGGDANGARELLTSPMYRRFIPKMKLDGPANVLDLGANNGGFPLLLAASGVQLKKVVSVELNPRTFTRLRFNLVRNLNCDVVPLNAAVCGEERTIEVGLGSGSAGDSIYRQSDNADGEVVSVKGLTFDQIYEQNFAGELIDICKMDVEGAEFEILRSTSHGMLSRCRYVIMEIHENDSRRAEEIFAAMKAVGLHNQPQDADADPAVHFFVRSETE